MTRTRRRGATTAVQVPKMLLDMPTEVLATICAFCDVPTKMRIEATCKRLRKILAHPGDDRALWGMITVRVDDRGCAMWDTTQIVSWLVQRAAGIGRIVVRPVPGGSHYINKPLHIALFAIAGAFQGTHVALEMRSSGARPDADKFWPFLKKFWAAPTPNTQPGLTALAATLTRLEVKYELLYPRQESLRYLCSLTRLEEATLWLTVSSVYVHEDFTWEASGGLPALRRLTIGGDTWCTEALLKETGPQLTSLSFHVIGTGAAGTSVAASWLTKLLGLRELAVKEFTCRIMKDVSFSHMTGLAELKLDFERNWGADAEVTIGDDFTFLTSFRGLRLLTLKGLNGVSDQLITAVLDIPNLERLHIKSLQEWQWSAANIGRLIARGKAERPRLDIKVDEPPDYDDY